VGRLLFNVLAMVAEFESDLIKMRTRERLTKQRERGA
jgi:DNA invertase Pin-like site-specific DNA recombinase